MKTLFLILNSFYLWKLLRLKLINIHEKNGTREKVQIIKVRIIEVRLYCVYTWKIKMADRSDLMIWMIKFDNHSCAMTRIENCQKVCCIIRVFVLLLEPFAFILCQGCLHSLVALPENNSSYATILLKNQQSYGKRTTKTSFADIHR